MFGQKRGRPGQPSLGEIQGLCIEPIAAREQHTTGGKHGCQCILDEDRRDGAVDRRKLHSMRNLRLTMQCKNMTAVGKESPANEVLTRHRRLQQLRD